MDIIVKLSEELSVQKWQVEAAVGLIDEGNTIPFISRYRKEVTGSLNDEQLRNLHERLVYLRNLEDKKALVLSSIEEQGKLTEELKEKILKAETMVTVEDLYRPYRPKRKTRASVAREKGLEGLANLILLQMTDKSLEEEAKAYISEEKERLKALENRHKDAQLSIFDLEISGNERKKSEKEREIEKIFNDFMEWEKDTLEIEENPYIRIIAVTTGVN